ncbi:hypothetical protein MYK68_01815 [Gordonia sp. PP30]|uniref:hypothetical protein n=1 Tax=Gordonia sp. PP30 TaxID=2935861 RepID=UPI00200059A2|nr:hypothetical protein [Gordonia sp. PP30]UQE75391.1 hypothetical protein MYK68_01815 [Gordonia sp. PP30]
MRRIAAVLVVVLVAAFLAGCSGSGKDSAGDRTGAVSTVTEIVTAGPSSDTAAPTTTTTVTGQNPATTVPTQATPTAQPMQPTKYLGRWFGHTRSVELRADGTGEVSLFSGAADGTVWNVTWSGNDSQIQVTMVSKKSVYGDGAPLYTEGQTVEGHLESQAGGQVLMLGGNSYCDSVSGQAGYCGA